MKIEPPPTRPKRIWPTFEEAAAFLLERAEGWCCSVCANEEITLDVGSDLHGYPQAAIIVFGNYGVGGNDVFRATCTHCGHIHDFSMGPIRKWLATKGREAE